MSYPESQASSRVSHTQQLIPRKQQWALINQYKALEFERMKQMEKAVDMEKKRQFKMQLDNQISSKSDVHQAQKQADRRYYEFITRKAEEMKMKQQREKMSKIMKRKQVEEENQHYLDHMRNSRSQDHDSGYHLEIGVKSEIERKNLELNHKRQMLDTLDRQLQLKNEQKRMQKLTNYELDEANLKYQNQQFERRKIQRKNFRQNQNVYAYYKNLENERRQKQRQFQQRMVEEAAMKKMQQEDYKRYIKQRQKQQLTYQMKHTLDMQVNDHQRKASQQKRVNPQQHSYSVLSNIFKQKPSAYNKNQYSEYLRRQAQQAQLKKKRQNYMSEEEYRINLNQLNRAVSGNYAHNKYLDRSVGAIGDNNKRINLTQMSDKLNDEDSEVVKQRLQGLKQRQTRILSQNQGMMY